MPRVALQLSGHLRGLCETSAHFDTLASLVGGCRATGATCDLFVHTWDELYPQTPTWHTWYPTDVPNAGVRSARCVQQLKAALQPAAVVVERQVLMRPANETWIVFSGRHRETHVSLAGLRSAISAVAAAAQLRATYVQSGKADPYDVAVRLRPDIYHRRNFRRNRRDDYRGVPVNQICTVPGAAWPAIISASVSNQPCAACVRGCDDETTPGNKSGDMCFWSSPPAAMDRLVRAWDELADEYLDANLCWQRWRTRRPERVAARGGRRAISGSPSHGTRPPCLHPETQWESSSAELVLSAAAAREGLQRSTLGAAAAGSFVPRSAKCT